MMLLRRFSETRAKTISTKTRTRSRAVYTAVVVSFRRTRQEYLKSRIDPNTEIFLFFGGKSDCTGTLQYTATRITTRVVPIICYIICYRASSTKITEPPKLRGEVY